MAMGWHALRTKQGRTLPSGPWKPCGEMHWMFSKRRDNIAQAPCVLRASVRPSSAGSGVCPVDELTRTQGLRQGLDEGLDFIANSAVVFQGLFFRLRRRR